MKKIFSISFALIIYFSFPCYSQAQAPAIQWQNTIGGSAEDQLKSIKQTADGGYILGGYSSSNISGDKTENSFGGKDYWIIKLSATGSIEWQKTIGGSGDDLLETIATTTGGECTKCLVKNIFALLFFFC